MNADIVQNGCYTFKRGVYGIAKLYVADTDWDSFNLAVRTYSTLNGIFQERDFFVSERIAAALIYA